MATQSPLKSKQQSERGVFSHRLSDDAHKGKHESFRTDEAFFRNVVESLDDYAVFTTDTDGNISSWNKGAERMLGYAEEEIIGQSADILFTPEDRAARAPQNELRKAVTDNRAINERYHLKKDGTYFWGSGLVFPLMDKQGILRGFTKVMRDLTLSKQTADKLKASEERFQTLIEKSSDVIALSDTEGTYSYVSPGIRKILGYTPEEFLGTNGFQLMHPDELAYISQQFQQLLSKPGSHRTIELRAKHKNGSWRWIEATATNLLNDPRIGAIVSNFRDITERKTVERALADAVDQAENFFNLPDLLLAIAGTDGYFTQLNPAWRKTLGYTLKELTSRPWIDFVHPDDIDSTIAEGEKLKKGATTLHFQNRYRCKDGSYKWILWNTRPVGKVLYAAAQDITPLKAAEERLKRDEERFALAQRAANIGTFEWNIKTDEFVCTTQLEALYGLEADKLGSKFNDWLKVIHPDDRQRAKKEIEAAIAGKPLDTEVRVVWPNGTVRWIAVRGRVFNDSKGKPERLLGINRNVTKRKEAEEHLRESEERFRQLADSMPQMVWTARPDGYLDYYNKQWYEFTGFKQDYGDQSWRPILHPDDVQFCNDTWYESVHTGKPYQIEYRFKDRHRPGKYRWFLGRALPIKDKKGRIVKWFGTCTDIDDVKRTTIRKEELERLTRQLKEQRRQLVTLNNAKDEFISLASHQLRTPATGVKQYVGMLLEGYMGSLTQEQTTMLNYAYDSNERQLKIIDDLLKVAHVDAGKVQVDKKPCNLVPLVHNVLQEQLSRFKERSQKLVFNKPDAPVTAAIDARLLRMVVENLVDNAGKYTPEGKQIKVKVNQKSRPASAVIVIQDQGVGIDQKDFSKLFQKFSRLSNPLSETVGGTGLGLYWVKRVIDLHGGTISVKSTLRKGTTFTIQLPIEA